MDGVHMLYVQRLWMGCAGAGPGLRGLRALTKHPARPRRAGPTGAAPVDHSNGPPDHLQDALNPPPGGRFCDVGDIATVL